MVFSNIQASQAAPGRVLSSLLEVAECMSCLATRARLIGSGAQERLHKKLDAVMAAQGVARKPVPGKPRQHHQSTPFPPCLGALSMSQLSSSSSPVPSNAIPSNHIVPLLARPGSAWAAACSQLSSCFNVLKLLGLRARPRGGSFEEGVGGENAGG